MFIHVKHPFDPKHKLLLKAFRGCLRHPFKYLTISVQQSTASASNLYHKSLSIHSHHSLGHTYQLHHAPQQEHDNWSASGHSARTNEARQSECNDCEINLQVTYCMSSYRNVHDSQSHYTNNLGQLKLNTLLPSFGPLRS